MSSRISAASAPGNTSLVPIRTTDDAQGNASAGHVLLLEAAGVAAPVTAANPVPIFGGSGPLADASGAVPTVTTAMLGAGPRRLLLVANVGAPDIFVNFGAAAAAGAGSIPIRSGGALMFGVGGGYVPSDAVNAIAAGVGGALTIKVA